METLLEERSTTRKTEDFAEASEAEAGKECPEDHRGFWRGCQEGNGSTGSNEDENRKSKAGAGAGYVAEASEAATAAAAAARVWPPRPADKRGR